jgi:glycosyltransferase involved in cell wall biosynthesis
MNPSPGAPARIAVITNSAWNLVNFRLGVLDALRAQGHRPVAVAIPDTSVDKLRATGHEYVPLALQPAGTHPLRELAALFALRRLLVRGEFDMAFTYTPKVNIYVGLARKGLALRHVPNVSGLGRVFASRSALQPLVTQLYHLAFDAADTVVFQNEEDRTMFTARGIVEASRTVRVPGSGVDLARFAPRPPRPADGRTVFLFVGRILRDKGAVEFVEAARAVRRTRSDVEFRMLGISDSDNPAAIAPQEIRAWQDEGVVDYLGATDDVRPALADADCVVLPSYREGLPRSLLEAAAMGKPCITTDAPGCRDAVVDGETGLICAVRDAASLASAFRRFLDLPAAARSALGERGRARVEREFDERIVVRTYVDIAARLAATR